MYDDYYFHLGLLLEGSYIIIITPNICAVYLSGKEWRIYNYNILSSSPGLYIYIYIYVLNCSPFHKLDLMH